MPAAEFFIDSNVLLYAVSKNVAEAEKSLIARSLLKSQIWAWSAQVAAEFYRASNSKRQSQPLTGAEAREWIEKWMAYPLAAIDSNTVLEAISVSQRYQISYFDAQIIAAAKGSGCKSVYTEDLNAGQDYGGIRVVNPFPS